MPLAVEWGSTETFLHSHVVHGFRVLASVWRKVPEIQFIDKFIEVPVQTLCCSNAHDIQMVGVWFKYVHIGRQTASDNNCLYAVYFIQFFILIFWMYFFLSLSLSVYKPLRGCFAWKPTCGRGATANLEATPKRLFGTVVPTFSLCKSLLRCLFRTTNIV